MSILSFRFLVLAAGILILYYLFPLRVRWTVLFAGSVCFVLSGGASSLLHLSAVALLTWLGGLALERVSRKRTLLGCLLVLEFSALVLVKYQTFAAAPLGLSYFTLQSAGLLMDIYRGKEHAQRNPLKVWLFTGFFLQLAQGPISSWKELGEPLTTGHLLDPVGFASGFLLLLWGYFKKMVLADRLAAVTEALVEDSAGLPGWLVLGGVLLYTVRLYADFSGGMDVVRGISRMLGIGLPENFRRPFFSTSVADYWRRWHITLGGWFRSYVLYPLTASRPGLQLGKAASKVLGKKTGRVLPTALATLLVFLLIGIWHGFYWNAVIYGAYFGLVMGASILLEPVWKKWNKRWKLNSRRGIGIWRILRTWVVILPAQFFAFTPSFSLSLELIRRSFENWSFADASGYLTGIMPGIEWAIAGIACLLLFLADYLGERGMDLNARLAGARIWIRWPVLLTLLLAVLIFGIYGPSGGSSAFLYTMF